MPNAALKPCAYPGCSSLVPTGYCERHKASHQVARDMASQGLYGTRLWKRIRERQLAKDPWCADCLRGGIYIPATDVDHVARHMGDKAMFFRGPFQSLCHSCHSKKTASETNFSAKGVGGDIG